ncbi:hypothetical protein QUB70_15340 [Microcoleus sp. A003_D6]|uniref:hypothetical protein n=1 Tax=Microcoleus sp. A003_D6 TaxID=3055266 RepID=UPI002FD63A10
MQSQLRQQIRPDLLMRTLQDVHWVKSSAREVRRRKPGRSHRTAKKKVRSSAPVNPTGDRASNRSSFPGSPNPAPPDRSGRLWKSRAQMLKSLGVKSFTVSKLKGIVKLH